MHPQTEFLLNHSATASPFASTAGQAFVSLPLGPFSHQVCSILSPRFRDWLIDAFYQEHAEPSTDYALRKPTMLLSYIGLLPSLIAQIGITHPARRGRFELAGQMRK